MISIAKIFMEMSSKYGIPVTSEKTAKKFEPTYEKYQDKLKQSGEQTLHKLQKARSSEYV